MKYTCKYNYDDVHIAGSQYYDHSAVCDGDSLELVPEPNNEYDDEAVAVMHNGNKIGHMHKDSKLRDMYYDFIGRGGKVTACIASAELMTMELYYFLPEYMSDGSGFQNISYKQETVTTPPPRVEHTQNVITPNITIHNENINTVTAPPIPAYNGHTCNKWISFLLCLFLGFIGAHKFYEKRIGMGILYLFTAGLFGFGTLVDLILILLKPNPYVITKK